MSTTISRLESELEERIADSEESMNLAEADGNSDYDYHQGRYEAYSALLGWLRYQDRIRAALAVTDLPTRRSS